MIKLVDRYSAIYGGHAEMSFLKASAIYGLAYSKQGQAQKNLRQEANQIQSNVCYWSQGQTEVASQRSCVGSNFYDADYPRRWYWKFSTNPKELTDLQNDSAALRRHHATLDDALLEAMISLEDAESRERQAQSHLVDLQSEWQSNQKKLAEERGQNIVAVFRCIRGQLRTQERGAGRHKIHEANRFLADSVRRDVTGPARDEWDAMTTLPGIALNAAQPVHNV